MGLTAGSWVVLTDLDGTLLDHATYSWRAATRALELLRRGQVPLILVTSKTRAEVLPVLRSLRRSEPFIAENGGAIYLPQGYFRLKINGSTPADHGWLRIALGTPRPRLVQALTLAAKRARASLRTFSEMSTREVAERTGLSLAGSRRARQREFDEPFVVLGGESKAISRLRREISRAGYHITRGSRFFHIMGNHDKGAAVRRLLAIYRRDRQARIQTVGIGDSPIDIPLLRAVSKPILVGRPGGRYDTEVLHAVPSVMRAGGVGPAGWNRAILRLLSDR